MTVGATAPAEPALFRTLYKYAFTTDERDPIGFAETLTQDVVLETEIVGGREMPRIQGRDTLVGFICGQPPQPAKKWRRHIVTNPYVVSAGEANAEVRAYVIVTDSVDGMFMPRCSGTYRMFMRKEPDAVWRLSYIGVHLDSELAGPLGWVEETSAT